MTALTRLEGLRVWRPTIGVGSFLTIEFGGRRATSTGHVQGEFHLWIYGAMWTISATDGLAANSNDSSDVMTMAAATLDGAQVKSAALDPSDLRLELAFDGDRRLVTDPGPLNEMEDWLLYLDDGCVISASPGGTLLIESASASEVLWNNES